jgi:hypothetical protein
MDYGRRTFISAASALLYANIDINTNATSIPASGYAAGCAASIPYTGYAAVALHIR